MIKAIPWEVIMPSTKYEGLSYPTHFLKSRGSIIRIIFIKAELKKATTFARRKDYYALFATNKAKKKKQQHTLNRHLVTQFIAKV